MPKPDNMGYVPDKRRERFVDGLMREGNKFFDDGSVNDAFERFREAYVLLGPYQSSRGDEQAQARRERVVHGAVKTLAVLAKGDERSVQMKYEGDSVVREILQEAQWIRAVKRAKAEKAAQEAAAVAGEG